MASFNKKTYYESTIDWDSLRQLAKRAAEETFEPHAYDYWVLQERHYFYEDIYNNGTRINDETHDLIEYCLGIDGRLFMRSTSTRERYYYNMSPLIEKNTTDEPMNDTNVINFDYKPQYCYDEGSNWRYNTDREPSDELLYPTKGAGLKARLTKLLDKSFGKFIVNADKGDENAQYYTGECYYLGKGVKQDYTKAAEWYEKAADQGNANAQYRLGDIYFHGYGILQDYAQALELYIKAAQQGFADAQYRLGDIYFNGNGVLQDYTQAIEWYAKAADQGNAEAQYALGECFQHGYGCVQDYIKAVEWYAKAAKQGNISAQGKLKELNQLIQEQKEKEQQDLERKKRDEEEIVRKLEKKQNNIFTAIFLGVVFIFSAWLFFSIFPGGSANSFYRWLYYPNGNISKFISTYIKNFLPVILFAPTIFIVIFKINKDFLLNKHKILWIIRYMPVFWMVGISAYFIFAGRTASHDLAFVVSFGVFGIPMLFFFLLFISNTLFAIVETFLIKESFQHSFGNSGCLLSLTVIPMFFIGYRLNPHIFDAGGYWLLLLCTGLLGLILNWIVDRF